MEDYLQDSEVPETLNCFNHSWFCYLKYYMYKYMGVRCNEEKLLLHVYVYSDLLNSKYAFLSTNYAYMYVYILISHNNHTHKKFQIYYGRVFFLRSNVFKG